MYIQGHIGVHGHRQCPLEIFEHRASSSGRPQGGGEYVLGDDNLLQVVTGVDSLHLADMLLPKGIYCSWDYGRSKVANFEHVGEVCSQLDPVIGESQPHELVLNDTDVDPTQSPPCNRDHIQTHEESCQNGRRVQGAFYVLSCHASAAVHSTLLSMSLMTVPSAHLRSKPVGLVYQVMAMATLTEVWASSRGHLLH